MIATFLISYRKQRYEERLGMPLTNVQRCPNLNRCSHMQLSSHIRRHGDKRHMLPHEAGKPWLARRWHEPHRATRGIRACLLAQDKREDAFHAHQKVEQVEHRAGIWSTVPNPHEVPASSQLECISSALETL